MTIALVNFNQYLGGGETLLVRWSEYLHRRGYDFKLFFVVDSYIEKDLIRVRIPSQNLCPIRSSVDYYYLGNSQRKDLRDEICSSVHFVADMLWCRNKSENIFADFLESTK